VDAVQKQIYTWNVLVSQTINLKLVLPRPLNSLQQRHPGLRRRRAQLLVQRCQRQPLAPRQVQSGTADEAGGEDFAQTALLGTLAFRDGLSDSVGSLRRSESSIRGPDTVTSAPVAIRQCDASPLCRAMGKTLSRIGLRTFDG